MTLAEINCEASNIFSAVSADIDRLKALILYVEEHHRDNEAVPEVLDTMQHWLDLIGKQLNGGGQ